MAYNFDCWIIYKNQIDKNRINRYGGVVRTIDPNEIFQLKSTFWMESYGLGASFGGSSYNHVLLDENNTSYILSAPRD